MTTLATHSPEDTEELACNIIHALKQDVGRAGTSTIIALQGNLGAGKTVFTKGLARCLGVEEVIKSPTFVIEKKYPILETGQYPWKQLIHIDAYRLHGEEDLTAIDWNTIATDPKNLIVIEWPEQVGLGVPERAYWIEFKTVDEHTRNIHLPETLSIKGTTQHGL